MTYLDSLLMQRQKIAVISDKPLEREKLETVIEAGRLAPYAGLAQKNTDTFRHFFVIKRGSRTARELEQLCSRQRILESKRIYEEGLDQKYQPAAFMAEHFKDGGAGDVFSSPWLIVIAERGAYPAREEVCLGYVMENMWLKATELQIAFKPCSIVSDLKDKVSLQKLLGLDSQEHYAFDACNIGYPKDVVKKRENHKKPTEQITYFTD